MLYLIGRYHEVALKGQNRWRFVEQLKRNLRALTSDYRLGGIHSAGPRLVVELPEALPEPVARERGALLFGWQNYSVARRVSRDLETITREALSLAQQSSARRFAVRTRRDDKRYPMTSMEIDRAVGGAIKSAVGMAVDLETPELEIGIEIFADGAFVSAGKKAGAGGLPVGISGRGLALLSGGIDSPVAAYRMMRRGLALDYVHFHSYPLVSRTSQEKVQYLAAQLVRYQGRASLVMVPFAMTQREIVARAPRPLRVVLYRRFMFRMAGALGARLGSQVLITGDSLGQVASQTLDNLAAVEEAAPLAVLRPLLAMDKNEIIEQARRLGTFETSIIPDQDCCSLFVPRHPETHARLEQVQSAEAALGVERMVAEALAGCQTIELSFPRRAALGPGSQAAG